MYEAPLKLVAKVLEFEDNKYLCFVIRQRY